MSEQNVRIWSRGLKYGNYVEEFKYSTSKLTHLLHLKLTLPDMLSANIMTRVTSLNICRYSVSCHVTRQSLFPGDEHPVDPAVSNSQSVVIRLPVTVTPTTVILPLYKIQPYTFRLGPLSLWFETCFRYDLELIIISVNLLMSDNIRTCFAWL